MKRFLKKIIIAVVRLVLSPVHTTILLQLNKRIPKFWMVFPSNRTFVLKKYLNEFTMLVNTKFAKERELLYGIHKRAAYFIIKKLVNEGDFCMEIGAGIGGSTIILAKATGSNGKVFAFEPDPFLYERLKNNVRINRSIAESVRVYYTGLSYHEGTMYWHERENTPGDSTFGDEITPYSIPVKVTTIDGFVNTLQINRLDFIKIDVGNMAYQIIMSGIKTYKRFRPILYYRSLKKYEDSMEVPVFMEIQGLLEPLDYSFFKFNNKNMFETVSYPDFSENTIALPKEKVERLIPYFGKGVFTSLYWEQKAEPLRVHDKRIIIHTFQAASSH
jgi:FkbM family methyltransferase